MPDRHKTFKPTPAMQKFLDYFQEQEYACPVAAAIEHIGIARSTYHTWLKNPDFTAWWLDHETEFFRCATGQVHAALLRAATSKPGTSSDRRLFLERFDQQFGKNTGPASGKTFEDELAEIEDDLASTPSEDERDS